MAASSAPARSSQPPSETQLAAIERLERSLAQPGPAPTPVAPETVAGISDRVPVLNGVPGQGRRRATVAVLVVALLGLAVAGAVAVSTGDANDSVAEEPPPSGPAPAPEPTPQVADVDAAPPADDPPAPDLAPAETAVAEAPDEDEVPESDDAAEPDASDQSVAGEASNDQEVEGAGSPPVAESTATVRNGQIFLEGAVPTQAAGDELAALAAEILGPDNVFNNYVVDPAAGDPDLGNVTVEDTITFEPDSAVLTDPSNPLLAQGVALMNIRPAMTITIVGHTDAQGSPAANDRLSLQRAEAIKAVFVERGIAAERLTTHGAGSSEPIATNDTAEGRTQNRRIQFFLENILGDA